MGFRRKITAQHFCYMVEALVKEHIGELRILVGRCKWQQGSLTIGLLEQGAPPGQSAFQIKVLTTFRSGNQTLQPVVKCR